MNYIWDYEYDYDYNEFDEAYELDFNLYDNLESDPDTIRIARQEVFYQNEDNYDYQEFHNAIHEPDSRNFLGLIPLPSFLDKENFDWDNADNPIREPMRYFTYYMNDMYYRMNHFWSLPQVSGKDADGNWTFSSTHSSLFNCVDKLNDDKNEMFYTYEGTM